MGKRRPDVRRMTVAKAPKDHAHLGICLQYAGTAFRGLQLQAHSSTAHTIEGVLVQAMKDIQLIPDVVRGKPPGDQHHFARSCRTDRGVHAIRNMISLFVPTATFEAVGPLSTIQKKLNDALPAAVQVANVMLLTGSFVPRHCCNRRVYRYFIPLYALLPPADSWGSMEKYFPSVMSELQTIAHSSAAAGRQFEGVAYVDVESVGGTHAATTEKDGAPSWKRRLRDSVEGCNSLLSEYFTGSRRFHNFSVDVDAIRGSSNAKVVRPDTDEALRVVYRAEVFPRVFFLPASSTEAPHEAIYGFSRQEYEANCRTAQLPPSGETESSDKGAGAPVPAPDAFARSFPVLPFLLFQIEGGSFLFNMIRKIVGAMLAVCRGARQSILDDAFSPQHRVTTPLAPGSYLFLALSTYHGYDRSVLPMRSERFHTIQETWGGPVAAAAERFAMRNIAAEVVDVDTNAVPPLDDLLTARDRAYEKTRPSSAVEDAHLSDMKEYKAITPTRGPMPVCCEMTIFLRLLRVHNWSVRSIALPPDCKAMLEWKNRKAREEREVVAVGSDLPEVETSSVGTENSPAASTTKSEPIDGDSQSIPDGGDDAWLYLGDTEEVVQQKRRAYFERRWKRSRQWEYTTTAAERDEGAKRPHAEDNDNTE